MVPVGLRRTVAHFKPLLFSAQHTQKKKHNTHTHTKKKKSDYSNAQKITR